MGKSLDALHLTDTPLLPVEPPDVRETAWFRFCQEIDDLILCDDYAWALDTLEGIRASVEQYQSVTANQRRAVEHIQAARRGRAEGWRKRRYEGFTRGGR
jgi:hypothetical protein